MDISSPKTIAKFIDLTILQTPKPQASSTVERKGVYSYHTDKTSASQNNIKSNDPSNMDIPTRDTDAQSNSSHHSSVSSLGILSIDHYEDINEEVLKAGQETDNTQMMKRSINETLVMQRLLAQRAMEKVDSKAKGTVGGLPSYLLKPTQTGANYTATPTKNESTINLSDLERSLPLKTSNASDRISFEVKEISARSSSLGNQKENSSHATATIDLRTPSPVRCVSSDFAVKCQDIYEQLRQSDASLTALCDRSSRMGMRTQPLGSLPLLDIDTVDLSNTRCSWSNAQQDSFGEKLQNELFTPAELAGDKLLADELSWRRAKDILPTDSYSSKGNNHLDMSCFSGYIGDADISLKSRENEKISISEFFRRRSEDVEDLDLKSSPEKKHEPVPLINLTSNTITDDDISEIIPEQEHCRMSTSSVLSVSKIADILAKMNIQETPTRAFNILMKKSSQNNIINTPNTISSDNSTLKNSRITQTVSPDSRSNSTLKENSCINGGSIKSPRRSENEAVLRDMTNLRSMTSDDDGEWTDAKLNNNGTISSIAESPSYSCSELEFSDDERTSSAASTLSDEWLHIDSSKLYKLYVDVSQNVPITLLSKTNHWLHVKVFVKNIISHNLGKDIVKIDILNNEGLLKPFVTEQFVFKVTSLVTGKFKILIKVEVSNTVTRLQQILEHIVIIDAEEPKIKVVDEILDFKLNPEACTKRLIFPIINESSTSFSMSLTIVQDYKWVFVFSPDSESDYDAESKAETHRLVTIPAGSSVPVAVDMRCPKLEALKAAPGVDSVAVAGSLRMQFVDSGKLLRQVRLAGRVGFTKVQFKTSCMPFVLFPGQKKTIQVRNCGVVPLKLSVVVSLPDTETCIETSTDNMFTVDTTNLVLKPGKVGTVGVTFNARDILRSVKRAIRLELGREYHRAPQFVLPIEGVLDSRSPDIKMGAATSPGMSPRRDRPGSASSGSHSTAGSLHTLPDGKLPIESTRTELVWGCVRPGRTNTQDFVLRNRCSQRVRLQAVIQGSQAFKFVKDPSENMTSMNLMLHALESRTISVSFCPSGKGAACARLMFLPIEQETSYSKRQMIQLYGYGGNITVDVQKVAKDTSGRMWLSFGRLDYRDTLHQMFVLRNTGSLTAFACLSVTCKVLYPFMDSSVTVFPTEAVIESNKEIEISVNFSPRPEDFKYIQKTAAVEVSEIASIKILIGPEPTRGRIRRIFNKVNSSNGGSGVMGQLTGAFVVPRLSAVFPGERIPSDVASCREESGALRDLLRDVDTRELALTVERAGPDCTTADAAALDDTLMFQSLVVSDTTALSVTRRASGGFCSVEPRRLTLTPAEQGVVLVRSHHSRSMPFEVCVPSAATEAGLQASPLVGVLPPGDAAAITILCATTSPRLPFTCEIMIYVENEVMEIELKIQSIQSRRSYIQD